MENPVKGGEQDRGGGCLVLCLQGSCLSGVGSVLAERLSGSLYTCASKNGWGSNLRRKVGWCVGCFPKWKSIV